MESTTFYLADRVNSLKDISINLQELIATGGGAKSDSWLQIKADIFGVPIIRPAIMECSVLGAAMIAGITTKVFSSPQEAIKRIFKTQRVFEPNDKRHKIYTEKISRYRRLFTILKDFLRN